MKALVAISLALASCVSTDTVECGNGLVCPSDTVCTQLSTPRELICATHDQIDPCVGKADGDACTIAGIGVARCYDGICQDGGCGNGRVEDPELCDDGNNASGDGCSADCMSKEDCGNFEIDLAASETCDDGNHIDHDGCSSTCQLERLHWVPRLRNSPIRTEAAMAYDPLRDRVVLFSGREPFAGAARRTDTWEWDGAAWTELHGAHPEGRIWSAMAFDGTGVMLYGGEPSAGAGLDDTWVFDGAHWTQRMPATSPGERGRHVMAYDSRRKRVVLFGGSSQLTGEELDETWEWDGTTWAKVNSATRPPARNDAMMAYDPVHGVMVLAGGHDVQDAQNPTTVYMQDTWIYDGTNWTDVTPSTGLVPGQDYRGMAWDTGSQRVLAVGTMSNPETVLAWNGTSWADVTPAVSPFTNAGGSVAAMRSSIVLSAHGYNETWLWQGNAWKKTVAPDSDAMNNHPFAIDMARDEIVMLGRFALTWVLSRAGWRQIGGGTSPAERIFAPIVYDPVNRNVVMFGGLSTTPSVLGDTWLWTGSGWSTPSPPPSPSPSARHGAALAFDGTHVTLFGGNTSSNVPGTPMADTWSWDGSAWTQKFPATSPPAMSGACAGWDPMREQMVVFGNGQTWLYDGTTWTQKTGGAAPTPRSNIPLVWNASRRRLVLGGGQGALDMWEWDGQDWSQTPISGAPPARNGGGWAASLDGQGTLLYGGMSGLTNYDDLWALRFDAGSLTERCDGSDVDEDDLVACSDVDCWQTCTPACPPGTSCPQNAPRCGDGTCDATFETCETCAMDCSCNTVCGDFHCGPGEVCLGDCP